MCGDQLVKPGPYRQPDSGATCRMILSSGCAMYSTPSWLGFLCLAAQCPRLRSPVLSELVVPFADPWVLAVIATPD